MTLKATSASVDYEIGSCHVRGRIGAKKENGSLVLISVGHSAHGNQLLHPAQKDFRLVIENASRRDGVDSNI